MTAQLAIDASHLTRTFSSEGKPVHALVDVSLQVYVGEHVAIVGKSGAGKSTLLNLIGALDRGYAGELKVFGQHLKALPDRALSQFRNRQIGFIFQAFNLLPNLSVGENVLLPASFGVDLDHQQLRHRAHQLLEDFGLGDRFGQMPTQMSGGERQRVAIARALLLRPPILVCDEPTGSLDTQTASHILQVLKDIQHQHGTALVVVTHDAAVAAAAGRIIALDHGRVVSSDGYLAARATP